LKEKNEVMSSEQTAGQCESLMSQEVSAVRKPFVEPEISAPVDVLETTTFFQGGGESTVIP
jgi:hypothetical protein